MTESSVVGDRLRILLGGGIGAGKSAVGSQLALRGLTFAESDTLGHEVVEPGGAAFLEVMERWPEVVKGGTVDRRMLAAIVFADESQLRELEAMTHTHIVRRIAEIGRRSARLVVEVPVLLELGAEWIKVYVAAPRSVRRERAILRGGTPQDVDQRMDRQAKHRTWAAWADEIITNDGTIEDLDREVDALWDRLQSNRGSGMSS